MHILLGVGFILGLLVRVYARRRAIRSGQIDPSTWTGLPSHHPRERHAEWIATWTGKAVVFSIVAVVWLYAIHLWAPDIHGLLDIAERLWLTLTGQ